MSIKENQAVELIGNASRPVKQSQGHIFSITENHSPTNPGVTETVTQISYYLSSQGWPTTVLAAGRASTPVPEGVGLVEFPLGPAVQNWRYPRNLKSYLNKINGDGGHIFHLHGVWGAPQWLAARIASQRRIPALITPNDMLSPWHWQDGRLRHLKKLIYWYSMAYPAFRQLSVIHATTPRERDHLAQNFPGKNFVIIPNAINLEKLDHLLATQAVEKEERFRVDSPYLLFLGRLHPKKGIELLIASFAQARRGRPFHLVIVGPDYSAAYTAKLRALVRHLGIEDSVTFLGKVFGPQKWHLYRNAWAFCAPSYSETVGFVNLEAAALGVPVVTTCETGLYDWEEGGGLLVHPVLDDLTRALIQVFEWNENERNHRGRLLCHFVRKRYSLEAVGPQWISLYRRLLEESG
jgi:glycosyltransferase involved in cell wall biosynthesis